MNVNVFAPELRGKIRKEISFIPGAWVEFYDDLTVGVVEKAQNAKATGDINDSLLLIIDQIADWNLGDSQGNDLPITPDSIKRLSMKLLVWISSTQQEILENLSLTDDKKKLSPES